VQFALPEFCAGGDRSLVYWRAAHLEYFRAEATRSGFTFEENDDVVFCRFALVWPTPA
jgi:uncharacterized protein YhfF